MKKKELYYLLKKKDKYKKGKNIKREQQNFTLPYYNKNYAPVSCGQILVKLKSLQHEVYVLCYGERWDMWWLD